MNHWESATRTDRSSGTPRLEVRYTLEFNYVLCNSDVGDRATCVYGWRKGVLGVGINSIRNGGRKCMRNRGRT